MSLQRKKIIALQPLVAALRVALCAAPVLMAPSALADDAMAAASEVVIHGTASPYAQQNTTTATRTDTPLIDTPQSITVVTRELIQDQAMQSIADAIRYVPGVVTAQGEGNRDTAVFRGNSSTSDFFIDGMRDDVQYYRDFYNIESVEALKGSNAMIFGRGGSGGVINRVSKEPVWQDISEASLTLGSWDHRRGTVDIGRAVNDNVAVRLNAMAEKSDSYRDGVWIKRSGINPTAAFRLGERTRAVLGYEHFEDERVADRGVPSYQGKPLDTDPSAFFGSQEASPTWSDVDAFNALIEHDFGNGVLLRNRTRYADYDKFYQNVFPGAVNAAGTTVAISAYSNATRRENLFNQTDVVFGFHTGAVRHKLLTGLEFGTQETDNLRLTGYFPGVSPTATRVDVPLSNPVTTQPVTFKPSATDADNHGKATVAAAYVQDQIEFSPQWQAVLGLRYDRFKVDFLNKRNNSTIEVTDTPVSPRIGLIYKPAPNVSLYGSYSIAFVPRAGEQLSSLSASNQAFDPEEFTNIELGAKWNVLPALALTGAVYRLERSNVAITDPLDPTRSILVDAQETRGVEIGLSGNITAAWSVMGGYAYQDAAITRTQSATAKEGAQLAQVPKHSLSLWNRYQFTPEFGAGLGVVYRDEIFTSTGNTVTLPGFTRVDAALYYKVAQNVRVQLNVENLFDRKYYASAHNDNNITPGSPRAVKLGLIAKF